ncbi:hypothetical protein [Burkholderia sp. BCC1993]|uniref:hypothetical protein n=1 Tax=Burkholderia sp. BCC1993 TaxID=2817444 RepID=UPI002AB0EEAA|nr:hypothetical protein [Burkholderia sp. BCC1993]
MLDCSNTPQNQRARDLLGTVGFGNDQHAQTFGGQRQCFDVIDRSHIDHHGLAGKLTDVGAELAGMHLCPYRTFAAQAVASRHTDTTCQQRKPSRTDASCAIEFFTSAAAQQAHNHRILPTSALGHCPALLIVAGGIAFAVVVRVVTSGA